jgi:hypothetical protein
MLAGKGSWAGSLALVAALLTCPSPLFGQRGGGGGHVGGPAAGGVGLSGGNHATGIDTKDDLHDFHQILAVQASPEQKTAFAAVIKSTALASAEFKSFVEQLGKGNNAQDVARHDKTLDDAVENARTLTRKFLEGFSEAQKSGLKEMIKRLGKADSELAQAARALGQAFETGSAVKLASMQLTGAAEGLGKAIADFQHEQFGLGQEMSMDGLVNPSDAAYNLPQIKITADFSGQQVVVATSGMVSKAENEGGENTLAVRLISDMTDLQHGITDVLRSRLNQTDRCGERIEIENATLTPQQPASLATVQLHYERWSCATMMGRESANEIVEGGATLEVRLTPIVAEDGTLRLASQSARVDADGFLGEALRSGALGDKLRDQIAATVLDALTQGGGFQAALPTAARDLATLKRAHFEGTGAGRLRAVMEGEIRVPTAQLAALTTELQRQSARAAEESIMQPELMLR